MRRLLRAKPRDPEVDAYADTIKGSLGDLTRALIDLVRLTVPDSREAIHHGTPKFCAGPELFCYVAAHPDHVRLGFFDDVWLDDPTERLEGNGKQLRYVAMESNRKVSTAELSRLIQEAAKRARAT